MNLHAGGLGEPAALEPVGLSDMSDIDTNE